MRTSTQIVLLLAMVSGMQLWLASCEDDGCCDDRSFGITGKVIDSLTTGPIDSAILSWDDTSSISSPWATDSTGSFAIELYGSNAILYVRKEGYKTESREFRNINSDQSDIDFKLVIQSKVNERR